MMGETGSRQFRKKLVVVEAWRYRTASNGGTEPPMWLRGVFDRMTDEHGEYAMVATWEGKLRALPGNWIIRGVKGEVYPCDEVVFDMTYEPAGPLPSSDKPRDAELVKELESLAQAIADNAEATWWDGAVRKAHEMAAVCRTLRLAASRLSVPTTDMTEERDAFEHIATVLLPMARGYAAEHRVGNNGRLVEEMAAQITDIQTARRESA